jgi:hypothetical protein
MTCCLAKRPGRECFAVETYESRMPVVREREADGRRYYPAFSRSNRAVDTCGVCVS